MSSVFATLEQAVSVRLGSTATVDVTLTVAQREAVAVTARSTLDRHSAAAAETFTATQLDELPKFPPRPSPVLIGWENPGFTPRYEIRTSFAP